MPGFLKKDESNIQVGLHVGGYSVKAVAISRATGQPELLNYLIKPVKDSVVETIKEVYKELVVGAPPVITSVAGPSVVVRYVEMPSMTDEELQSAMSFEAEKVIPYKVDEVELDSIKAEDLEGNRMRVIFVAAKKDLVALHLEPLQQAGITPLVLDIDSFALMNAFVNAGIDKEHVSALINIGAKRTNLNIIKGDMSYLARDIDVGGNDITKLISESMSLDTAEAQKFKEDKLSNFSNLDEDQKQAIAKPLNETLSELADELRLSFDFYENRYASGVVNLYISGGTAKPEIVTNLLKELFGREVARWNPLQNIKISSNIDAQSLSDVQSELAVAIGLGLRRA